MGCYRGFRAVSGDFAGSLGIVSGVESHYALRSVKLATVFLGCAAVALVLVASASGSCGR